MYNRHQEAPSLFSNLSDMLNQQHPIGHLKSDYRLGRNFYKGVDGDSINILLAAAVYNFKRAMKVLLALILDLDKKVFEMLFCNKISMNCIFLRDDYFTRTARTAQPSKRSFPSVTSGPIILES